MISRESAGIITQKIIYFVLASFFAYQWTIKEQENFYKISVVIDFVIGAITGHIKFDGIYSTSRGT